MKALSPSLLPALESRIRLAALIVDDDEDDALLLGDVLAKLRQFEVTVTWCGTYESALRAKHDAFDIILVDHHLGRHTGMELLRTLTSYRVTAPIILFTGIDDPRIDAEAAEAGASDFLVKGEVTAAMLDRSFRYALAWSKLVTQLRERDASQRRLIDSMRDGILVHDLAGHIVDVNETLARMWRMPRDEIIGNPVTKWLPLFDVRAHLASGDLPPQEVRFARGQGGSAVFEWQCKPFWDARSLALTSVRDVTHERKLQEQAVQRERLVTAGLLTSSFAHEIGTPLAVVRGRAEMLLSEMQESHLPEAKLKTVTQIIQQIDRISHLIQTLLSFMRGEGKPVPAHIALSGPVREALELLTPEFRMKDIEVTADLDDALCVRADPASLSQVLINLLMNAVQAIESRSASEKNVSETGASGRIHIVAVSEPEGVALCVSDNGCGMAPEVVAQIFEPFFTTKDVGKGTGLGLSILLKDLEAWGARIFATSVPDQGTVFRIVFPKSIDSLRHG